MTVPDVEPSAMRAPGEVVFTRVDIARATMRVAADLNELWFETKPWILKYAPAEREMAESLRK